VSSPAEPAFDEPFVFAPSSAPPPAREEAHVEASRGWQDMLPPPASSMLFGAQVTTPAPSIPEIQYAPLDRQVTEEAAPTSLLNGESDHHSKTPDLDELAEDVFTLLRWRLEAERERAYGGQQ
jgi:hypothetical protein